MARIRLGAVVFILALAALPFCVELAVAGEAKAGEEGFTIAESENFSLDAHFLIQPTGRKYRKSIDFEGELYSFFNSVDDKLPNITDYPNLNEDRRSTDLPSTNTFRIRRARAMFGGRAFAPWLHWRVELEGFGDKGKAELLDAYLEIGDPKHYALTAGQFKTPFDLFQLTPAWKQLFIERSQVTRALVPNRDIGVMFSARSESGRLLARAAIQNGSGRNDNNTDSSLETTIRLEYQNEGGFEYDLSALTKPESTQYTFGLAWLRNNLGTQLDNNTGLFCVEGVSLSCSDNGNLGAGLELFGATRFNEFQISANIQRWTFENMRPWTDAKATIFPEIRSADEVPIVTKDLNLTSYEIQGSMFTSEKFELVARIAQVNTDDPQFRRLPFGPDAFSVDELIGGLSVVDEDRPNVVRLEERIRDWGIGFNFYIRKHNAKIHAGFTQVEVRDKVQDMFFSYVPDRVPEGYSPNPLTGYDFKVRNGRIFRRNASFNAMVTFYL